MANKTKHSGCVHVYTGNGKGKTTSALGLTIRALGYGMRVFIGQFMKGEEYSEIEFLKNVDNLEIEQFGWVNCIRKEDVKPFHKEKTAEGFEACRNRMISGNYDLVILDEILVSVWFGLIDEDSVLQLIKDKPENCELVLTGRYAGEKVIQAADLVTEMKCIKHYYETGMCSRKGIEF